MEEKLDLKTLKSIKFSFDICSDHSTLCLGYRNLCRKIEELEKLETLKKQKEETAFDVAEELIENLNEHRT